MHPEISFHPQWISTTGDRDKITPLTKLTPPDFFTKEIEELQLLQKFRISIHSAKDLPKSLTSGLIIVAITHGLDPRDALVLRKGHTLKMLGEKSRIGTSSERREASLRTYIPSFISIPIRGTIEERLMLLEHGRVDALVIAEAALIRLNLTSLHRILLDTPPELLQGKLAVIALKDDLEMASLFSAIDSRTP